jgi:peptidoglycan biosynthesis protein MviN/MurJ (putative lipid II flippase)
VDIRKTSLGLGSVKALKVLLSMGLLALSSAQLGADHERDTLLIGLAWTNLMSILLFSPTIDILRSVWVEIETQEGLGRASESLNHLLFVLTLTGALVCFATWIVPEVFLNVMPGHFDPLLLRVFVAIVPLFLFQSYFQVLTAVANTQKAYFSPDNWALVGAVLQLGWILHSGEMGGVLVWVGSYYLSLAVPLLALVIQLSRSGSLTSKFRPSHLVADFFQYSKRAGPLWIANAWAQGAGIIERNWLSSAGVGALSQLDYAKKLVESPMAVTQGVLASVLLPTLTREWISQRTSDYLQIWSKAARFFLLIWCLLAVVLSVWSEEWIALLLSWGKLKGGDVRSIAATLRVLAVGGVFASVWSLMGQGLLARGRSRDWGVAIACIPLFQTGLGVMLYSKLGPRSFAYSWTFSYLFVSLGLTYFFFKAFKKSDLKELQEPWVRALGFSVSAWGVAWGLHRLLASSQSVWFLSKVELMTTLSTQIAFWGIGLFLIAWLLKLEEFKKVLEKIRSREG